MASLNENHILVVSMPIELFKLPAYADLLTDSPFSLFTGRQSSHLREKQEQAGENEGF